jgi:hypothetical protein
LYQYSLCGPKAAPAITVQRKIGFALLLIATWLPLQCATLERLSLADMVARSTAIVRGKVMSSYAAFSGPVIYAHYIVQISEQYKGASQASVEVVIPGGTANNLRQSFAGAPTLTTGSEYVLFLFTGRSGLTSITGLTQGLFTLAAGSGANPAITRSASRELMLDPLTGRPVKDETLSMQLSDLRSQIAADLQGAGAQ